MKLVWEYENCVKLVWEYNKALIKVVDSMDHTIRLIPYENGEFEMGISDASSMALTEQEERIYKQSPERKS